MNLAELIGVEVKSHPEAARYLVLGVLGTGAMGRVLLARDQKTGTEVAVKLMEVDDNFRSEATMRFYREAKALTLLDHPSVLHVLAYSGANYPRPFLVTERLHGVDLERLIAAGTLNEPELAALGVSIARGLHHAHLAGIVHRDVKPSNIMVEPDGRLVVIDFGLVKGTRKDVTDSHTFYASETRLVGTPDYTSPEQCTGKSAVSARSDLFSLGSVLFFAATGNAPFYSDSTLATVQAVADRPHPALPRDRFSAALTTILDKLLEKEPERRFASGDEVERALLERCSGEPQDTLRALVARRKIAQAPPAPLDESEATLLTERIRLSSTRDLGFFRRFGVQRMAYVIVAIAAGLALLVVWYLLRRR